MQTFGDIRKVQYAIWMQIMRRKRGPSTLNDDFTESYECEWQEKYTTNQMHNSVFCSFGEWSNHITDWLSDKRYDKYSFINKKHKHALFRHYTRLLLVVSEVLNDLTDLYMLLEKVDQMVARQNLSLGKVDKPYNLVRVAQYVNTLCKHKLGSKSKDINKLHNFNHHLEPHFMESGGHPPEKSIPMLQLNFILSTVQHAYLEMDELLKKNYESKYVLILNKFEVSVISLFPKN